MPELEERLNLFEAVGQAFGFVSKKRKIKELPSIVTRKDENDGAVEISPVASGIYGHFLDIEGKITNDFELIGKYRELADQPEIDFALSDIVNDAIVIDNVEAPVSLDLDKVEKFSDKIKETITEEFSELLKLLNFNNKGSDIFRQWYVDGRLYYHTIIDDKSPKLGIQEIRNVDPRRIKKVREVKKEKLENGVEIINGHEEYYVYNSHGFGPTNPVNNTNLSTQLVRLSSDLITYITSGKTTPDNTQIISHLHKAIKPMNQLRMLEDSVVIYRLARAPERRIFYIDTGNLPTHKAEEYVQQVKSNFKNKLVYDVVTGNLRDDKRHMCLSMDTKVPLLDGRTLTLNEITEEYNSGKTLWAYSCDPNTGKFMPGLISWAGVTRKNADVIRLTLDNGKEIICTPDHKFPTWNKGFIRADELSVGESMIPHYRKGKTFGKNAPEYEMIFKNDTKKWGFTHRIVSEWKDEVKIENEFSYNEEYSDSIKNTVHHKNINPQDNTPENIFKMNNNDHFKMHHVIGINGGVIGGNVCKDNGLGYFNRNHPEYTQWHINAGKKGGRVSSDTGKSQENLSKGRKILAERINDPEWNVWFREQQVIGWTDEKRKQAGTNAKNSNLSTKGNAAKIIEYDDIIIETVKYLILEGYLKKDIIKELNSNETLLNNFYQLNYKKKRWKSYNLFINGDIDNITNKIGYSSMTEYSESIKYRNHKITKIENLSEKIDTGCITIDGEELYHNHHTFALDAGIYTKNSMLEDLWLSRKEGCFSLDTKIKLLDGRDVELNLLISEFNLGKTNWVYSVSPNGVVVPGKISWAGITRENSEIIDVYLDNDEIITCTPDHKFILRNGEKIEAKDLQEGSSLMPLYTEKRIMYGNKEYEYTLNNETKKWNPTHRIVNEYFNTKQNNKVIHHKNFNRFDNNPDNLELLGKIEHLQLHSKHASDNCINHKVVKVVFREDRMNVGTLTIDDRHEYHDYHNFALSAGVFVMNSRGTEVVPLPSGQNLGELSDVEYFKKRLMKALNVPYSRLDSETQWTLGRATEITRDEVRFAHFIQGLRNKFNELFDSLLQKQLTLKGIITDEDWCEIKRDINYKYATDSYFFEMKKLEVIKEKFTLLQMVDLYSPNGSVVDPSQKTPYISFEWINQNVLFFSDEEINIIGKQKNKDMIEKENEAMIAQREQMSLQAATEPDPKENASSGGSSKSGDAETSNSGKGQKVKSVKHTIFK